MFKVFLHLLIILPLCCTAQQKDIDSLLSSLQKHPDGDTVRMKLLSDISYSYYQLNPTEGLRHAEELITISRKAGNMHWQAMGYARKGLNHSEMGNSAAALENYKYAEKIFLRTADENRVFGVRNSMAVTYMYMSEFSKALDIYFINLRFSEQKNNEQSTALTCGNIALVYKRMGNYQQALVYNQKAIDTYRKIGEKKLLADALNSRANMYDALKDMQKALPLYRESMQLSETINYSKGVAAANANLANIFTELGLYDSAVMHVKKAMVFYESISDKSNVATLLNFMGNLVSMADEKLLLKEKISPPSRYEKANEYYKQSLALNIETEDLASQAENLQGISNTYKKLRQYDKALEAYEQYAALKDSILSDENMQAIQQSEKQYAVKRNEDSLLLLQQKKDLLVAAEINRQKSIQQAVVIGGSLLLLAATISFVFYKKRRDAKQKQQEAEFKTEVADTEMKALRSQMNPHFIFNSLNSISDYIAKNNIPEADRYLSKFAKLMRLILENSEQKEVTIAEDLKALELYMQLEALRLNNKFLYEIQVDKAIDTDDAMIPPLMLQPFVENSIWHGIAKKEGAGKITIRIQKAGTEMISCTVEDDGIGRRRSNAMKTGAPGSEKTSLGMKITQSRIDILNRRKNSNAAITVTDPEQGLRVEIRLPISTKF